MKNLYAIVMLGILLAPSLAVINWSSAQETATVTQVAGASDANNPEFFVPEELTITVGTTVIWLNDDSATHTVTSGDIDDPENWGTVFESGLTKPRVNFEHTFDTAGEYPYLCMLHPWMIGKIIVVPGDMAPGDIAPPEGVMPGTNLDLMIDPLPPFDRMAGDEVTLSFMAKAKELEGASISPGKIDHLDYKVVITKDGMEVWSKQFHDHDGNLELVITPSSGSVTVTGGEEDAGKSMTGPYMVSGPIFTDNGNYAISGQIVGIEFNPLSSPLIDDFSMEVVPEFPITAILPMVVAFGAVIAAMRLRPKPKSII
ncbi:MAG: plastocyanin/azurin family copper-binding protein [Nitrososphaerales archaeon]